MKNRDSKAILKSIVFVLLCLMFVSSESAGHVTAKDNTGVHLLILGDPHLPGKNLAAKEQVIQTINSWGDVNMVIPVGDICEDKGTDDEYAAAKQFFAGLKVPVWPIAGNHDYFYEDVPVLRGTRIPAAASKDEKLRKFQEIFGLRTLFYSKKVSDYLLVFLSPDTATYLAGMSDKQLQWLHSELEENRKTPTIIFFHAPLKGTFLNTSRDINVEDFIAQPSERIDHILQKNPQVFLWVSGHTHFTPKDENFASPVNVYKGHITNIHNADMTRETIWTNSLFLYPDEVVVKTYDHKKRAWLPAFDRTIMVAKHSEEHSR